MAKRTGSKKRQARMQERKKTFSAQPSSPIKLTFHVPKMDRSFPPALLQLFVMGEVAVELFQESPTAFLQVRDGC